MKNINTSLKSIIIFYLFLIVLLIIGFQCKYNKPDFCQIPFFSNFWNENGFLENLQSIFLLISIIFLFIAKKKFKKVKIINIFLILKIMALIYFLGEEISWGQHIFKWESSNFFKEINNQKETNIHNISNLFDQLPRSLVFIWCGIIPIFFFFLKNKFFFKKEIMLILSPEKNLIFISIILLFFTLPDLFVDKFNIHPGHVDEYGKDIIEAKFYDYISFNFIRLSELHELIFTFYFLIYSVGISKKNF